MKNIIIFCFLIISFKLETTASTEIPEEELIACQQQAAQYGNGKGNDYISPFCLENFRSWAGSNAIAESIKANLKIYGFKNMIIIDEPGKRTSHIIAGSSTEIKSVKAIALDEKNNEIAVLEDDGKIFFFSTTITGNIAPFRTLINKALPGSTELIVDSAKDQVAVYNPEVKKIFYFSRKANIHTHGRSKKLEVLKSVNLASYDLKDFKFIPYMKGQ